ncbi:MAG: beta-lactamase family protein [Candidatus Eisenbacteria bacterium]|nr:beta-lactamase family protein [Candidatus Eisenbacteria bacterium]
MTGRMILSCIVLACTMTLAGCGRGEPMADTVAESLQAELETQRATKHMVLGVEGQTQAEAPGLSAAVILPDGSVWTGTAGISSATEPMTPEMRFGLASVTKTYVAALVHQLADEGVLSLDDPIGQWVDGLGGIDPNITLEQLLHHTSGIHRYQQKPAYLGAVYADPEKVWTPREILETFQGEPECEPGACFGESAMDYVLLGMAVEKATGSPAADLLTARILDPLGLAHTCLYPDRTYPVERMAHMWWDLEGAGKPVDVVEGSGDLPLAGMWSALWTSGAMHATAEDLARFARALFEGDVLSDTALDAMLTSGPELGPGFRYGSSVMVEQVGEKTAYWHPGGAGYASVYYHVPDDGITVAVLGNLMVDLKPVARALHQTCLASE